MKAFRNFFASGRYLHDQKLAIACWFLLPLIVFLQTFLKKEFNNFLIFRQVFFHLHQQKNLYLPYPAEYGDVNLYGPAFGVFVAPFAVLPVSVGVCCWTLFHLCFLGIAIYQLPLPRMWRTTVLLLSSHEMMVNTSWMQTNGFICGCLLLGFALVHKQKEWAALFFILLATFVKVYGIVGLCFFLFSKQK
ncbi:MAG TPA: glycosyltransferase family 87 protein, partial [Flavisolibacter sp.]|nr:glycosyltransferase family 87 protein [Flavisolibacter sp.]